MSEQNDSFLSQISHLQNFTSDQGWIKITMKRELIDQEDLNKKRPFVRRSVKKEQYQKLLQDFAENPTQQYNLRFKVKDNNKNRESTFVENHKSFTSSLINVFRLHYFKGVDNASKKIQKQATKADPNSKRQKNKQIRHLKNQESRKRRNKNRSESKRLKQSQQAKKIQEKKEQTEKLQQQETEN